MNVHFSDGRHHASVSAWVGAGPVGRAPIEAGIPQANEPNVRLESADHPATDGSVAARIVRWMLVASMVTP